MNRRKHEFSHGFSLIELIVVIVILSILAVFGSQFVVTSTQNYEQTRTRALLVNTGRQALEQMTRQLRGALPYSVITTNDNTCIKFMPIANGGIYNGFAPDVSNQAPTNNSAAVTTFHDGIVFGEAYWVSVGAMSPGEIYTFVSPSSLASILASPAATISTNRWLRNSINRRFYLLDNPKAFCVTGTQLRLYLNAGMSSTTVDQSGASVLMASHVAATSSFDLTQGSENRQTVVLMNIDFTSGGETVNFQQQVMIRNVP